MQSPKRATGYRQPVFGSWRPLWGLLALTLFTGCSPSTIAREFSGETMGTTYRVRYLAEANASDPHVEIRRLLEEITQSLSTYLDTSIISRVNGSSDVHRWHAIDVHFERVFRRSLSLYEDTQGAFNPAIAPLIDAWGFGRDERESLPDPETVRALLELTALDGFQIEMHPPRIRKPHPEARLNFNAIGEGYTIDAIASILESRGVKHYLIELGGEVRTKGKAAAERLWRVGIAKPAADALAATETEYTIALEDAALATSGNYRNYRIVDGRKVSHILNPATGYPENSSLLGVSVLAADATTADAFATALMVMGVDEGLRFVESRSGIEALFFFTDSAGEIAQTRSSGFPAPLAGL